MGAGSRMKLMCRYSPCTTTQRAAGASARAARASWVGTPVSTSGASTREHSPGRARTRTPAIGENSGPSSALVTSTTAVSEPRRATT